MTWTVEQVEQWVKAVVDEAPPLTEQQSEQLARLLGPYWGQQ